MRRTALALALLALPFFSAFADDPQPPKPDLYVVHEEVVPPGMMMKYEAVTKEMLGTFAAKNVMNPNLAFSTFMTNDMHYVYLSRLTGGLNGLEAMYNAWMSMPDTVGKDKWKDLETRGSATMSSYNEVLIMRRPDLSYEPASPRLKLEEQAYYRWQFYYLQPGKESEAEQICRDYAALFKSKNVSDGFTIFMAMMGQDLPLLVAAIPARSPADFAMVDEKNSAMLGNDLRALQMRALSITRRLENREGWYRPDLSYPMPSKSAK
jgi:hypothetical protein